MHIVARLHINCTQLSDVIMRITAIPWVISPSEEVIDNRGGCYGDCSLSRRAHDKENIWWWRNRSSTKLALQTPDRGGGAFTCNPANMGIFGILKLLSQNPKLREKKLDLGADQGYSRYNVQFFGLNTNRSAKAYYFRLNYDQWPTVGLSLFKTKAPSFLPAGLQKGKI